MRAYHDTPCDLEEMQTPGLLDLKISALVQHDIHDVCTAIFHAGTGYTLMKRLQHRK